VNAEVDAPIPVCDLHVDIPWQVHFRGLGPELAEGMARLDALVAGHYTGIVLPIYLPDGKKGGPTLEDADAIFASIERIIGRNPVFLPLLAERAEPGRIATFLSIEGAGAFAADIPAIDRFLARGLRLVSPCHARNSALASSATDKKTDHGLTELGARFCERVYAGGALVDVSHVSDVAFDDLVPLAKAFGAPLVASHSNARAIAGHARDLTDAQLRAIGETGGVAGLVFHAPFISGGPEATLDDLARQASHMVNVAGIEHVAIGSDFDGGIRPPAELADASGMPALARKLRQHGMSRDDVLAIFSRNAFRVLPWRPAREAPRPETKA
jgi:membrane dipeptidase